ncbi:type II toxin-antitoxin system HicA family toxin [Streptomyces sp. NPDC127098]|uniref:type II toxin-antitoxin system HicA family toxin n=1 Tax=Streptomyces sp. NPDC127098 TaxID=3347137 RepID=UPI0036649450
MFKALERLGFEQRRGKGSHTVTHRSSAVVVIPHRNPIPRGTPRNVLKQAGVSLDELTEAL